MLLASDLDNTVLPAPPGANDPADLAVFRSLATASPKLGLAYATGRSLDSAVAALAETDLPRPDHLICDVGTSIHDRLDDGWLPDAAYADRLAAEWPTGSFERARDALAGAPGLRPQADANQSAWKASYILDAAADGEAVRAEVAARLAAADLRANTVYSRGIESEDLLDVLPPSGGKLGALRHLLGRLGLSDDDLIFSGDSGNDADVLLSGCRAILVGNAHAAFRDRLRAEAAAANLTDRLHCAAAPYLGGVLEGYRRFGLLQADPT